MTAKAARYGIEYTYPGTVNGKPVGRVLVVNVEAITMVPDTWSYTRDPEAATSWASEAEAEAEAWKHWWQGARVIRLDGGKP